jgi:hypothetical protein
MADTLVYELTELDVNAAFSPLLKQFNKADKKQLQTFLVCLML